MDDVTLNSSLTFDTTFPGFEVAAFRGGPDYGKMLEIMNGGQYAITVASAKCLVFSAAVKAAAPPCLSPELLEALAGLKEDDYSEYSMNAFFNKFGTHAITSANFGSRYVTSAKYVRE